MVNGKLPWPVFNIKPQDYPEKRSCQQTSKDNIEKLVVSKSVALDHVCNMIDKVIDMIYNIKAANFSLRKCKKALSHYHMTTFILPNEHAALFYLITIPKPYVIHDTISLQNSVLELIWNLQLGDYKNVYEAKCKLTPDCMLPANFGRYDLFIIIKNFECKTALLLKVKKYNSTKLERASQCTVGTV
jgi:hypothetical protein